MRDSHRESQFYTRFSILTVNPNFPNPCIAEAPDAAACCWRRRIDGLNGSPPLPKPECAVAGEGNGSNANRRYSCSFSMSACTISYRKGRIENRAIFQQKTIQISNVKRCRIDNLTIN